MSNDTFITESYVHAGVKALNEAKKAGGRTINPFSSRLFKDQRIRNSEKDAPKTGAGRAGLAAGRYYGATQGGATGMLAGGLAGGAAGTAAGAVPGAVLGALVGKPGQGATLGANVGSVAGATWGAIKGTTYGARKGAALGGRAARYIATGTTKRPSEK